MEYNISCLSDINRTIPAVNLKTDIDRKSSIYLLNNHSDLLVKEAKSLKKFAESYSKIVATQDPDYIKYSDKNVVEILQNIFKRTFKVQSTNIEDYYNKIKIPLIPNLKIDYYKENNSFKVTKKVSTQWEPNIIEWKNSNGDKIELQLLSNTSKITIGQMISQVMENSTGDFIRVSNYNKKYESTLYFTYRQSENKIKGYYLDESSGNIYILILQTYHKNRLLKSLDDYLKIAMGISFSNDNTLNKFAIMQKNIETQKKLFCSDDFLDKVENYNDIYDELNKYGYLASYYGFVKLRSQDICYTQSKRKWLEFYQIFKEKFGYYPNRKANIHFANLFYKMDKLENYFNQEKSNVREDIGLINTLRGFPYNYVEIKASIRVKNKYRRNRF